MSTHQPKGRSLRSFFRSQNSKPTPSQGPGEGSLLHRGSPVGEVSDVQLEANHLETPLALPSSVPLTSQRDHEDQYGLKLIAAPVQEQARLDADAPDIIAIHGIGGNAWTTWTHKNGTFWLKELLPGHYPSARVFSFGYQATVAFTRGRGNVKTFARSLLEGLNSVRYDEVRAYSLY